MERTYPQQATHALLCSDGTLFAVGTPDDLEPVLWTVEGGSIVAGPYARQWDGSWALESEAVTDAPATELAKRVRAERDRRIAATDYLLMPDYPLEGDARDHVRAYRQALRDMPEQPGFPWNGAEDAPWPVLPIEIS